MTPEQIAAALPLCEAVPDGPWRPEIGTHACCVLDQNGQQIAAALGLRMAEFIAAARTGWPAALKEVERLRAQIDGHFREHFAVTQALGKALGYPTEGPEVGGDHSTVCIGEHVPGTIAAEAAAEIERLRRETDHFHSLIAIYTTKDNNGA